jgi:hypothetical protein
VEKLEKRLALLNARRSSVAMTDSGSATREQFSAGDPDAPPRTVYRGKAAKQKEASDIDELVSDLGFL